MRRKVSVLLAAQNPDSHMKAPGQQQVSQGGTCDPTRENRTKVKRWVSPSPRLPVGTHSGRGALG